jgi:hypothetical protein
MRGAMNLRVVAGTPAPSKFQQLINQVQAFTQAMLASQWQHQTLSPSKC